MRLENLDKSSNRGFGYATALVPLPNNAFHRINIKNKYAFPVNWWFLKQIFGPQINEGSAHASIAAAPETPGLRNIEENINLAPDTADGMQKDDILFEMMRNEGLVSDDSSDEHE